MTRPPALFVTALVLAASAAAAQGTPPRGGPAIDGPAPPDAPASVARDASGRATLRAHRVTEAIRIDGVLDEPVYERIRPIGDFTQYEPFNGAPATEQTEVWILFDSQSLYVAGRAYDSAPPERWVLNKMRRDIPNVSANESVAFSLDTFNDNRNGFLFELNALGGFLDAQITNEGFPPNQNWNTVWEGRSGRFDGGWTFEIAVPFRSIRYQPGVQQVWGFNMRRVVRGKNEESHIVPVPAAMGQRRGVMQVSLNAPLVGVEVPPGSRNLELRLFGIASLATDEATGVRDVGDGDAGLDVKYGVTQNLTADLTVNTDFAQVEVDEQQVNLTRSSLFFPEKRTFFLEGQGTFDFARGAGTNVGGGDVPTLFFSRRIGLNRGQTVPIDGGGRLTGKVGPYSIGLLDIQTDAAPAARAVSTNFGVVRVKRDVLRRSAVGVLYAGRSRSTVASGRNDTYGIDGTFSFYDNLNVNAYVAATRTPGLVDRDLSYLGQFNYAGDRYGLVVERLVIEEHFNPEVGFVRRPDLRKWSGTARFSPRPSRRTAIRKWLYEAGGSYLENNTGQLESRALAATWGIDLQNGDTLRASATRTYELLARPFPIAAGVTVPVGGYEFDTVQVRYGLGPQRRLGGTATIEVGSFYDGDKVSLGFSAGRLEVTNQLQLQPGVSLNWVRLPSGDFTAQQVQTRAVYTMTPRAFLAALVQYNSANSSVGTNLRLRWEYRPGSELFVVYNDERDTRASGFPELSNRALIVKIAPLLRF
ncbi:MAG: carbohydrate binding family 9 domain-containing protein [Acidobacteria bacterium]|nr:carbohydrate binding family 9 domain-containing protein [Acidobacteriota bacterium]